MELFNTPKEKYIGSSPLLARRPQQADSTTKAVRGVFGLLAIAAVITAAIYSYGQEESIWLSIFVAGAAGFIVGRVVPDVITDSKKVRRTLYFLLFPAIAVAILYLTYQAWETWWLAVMVSWVGAFILNGILAPLLFPGIHREETEDTVERWRELKEAGDQ